jgi:hypothetical protein
MLGEVAHHLRSALDLLVDQLRLGACIIDAKRLKDLWMRSMRGSSGPHRTSEGHGSGVR